MFVRYSCGCIAIRLATSDIAIQACDGDRDDDNYTFCASDRSREKSYIPLDKVEKHDLIKRIGDLVYNGYRFEQLKRILK